MDNETIGNETIGNETSWFNIDIEKIPSLSEMLANAQKDMSELLTSWNMMPETTYFQILVGAIILILFYQSYIWITSKTGGGFKWLVFLIIAIIIVVAVLGVEI